MRHLYNFGLSQEDELSEAAALKLSSDDRVISIASAGDMPLSLAALGAKEVVAIDIDPAQMALASLKLASSKTMHREESIGFLGYMHMEPQQRLELYDQVRRTLSPDVRAFWDEERTALCQGAVWAGRFERYLLWIRRLVVPILGKRNLRALLECRTITEQEILFDRSMDRPILRSIFRLAFHPKVFSGRGMDPRSLAYRSKENPLGEQYYGWFRSFLTATLASENYLMQLSLFGRVVDSDAVPAYLSREGYECLQKRPDGVELHLGDLLSFLKEAPPAHFDRIHLSNICDWMDQESFEQVMRLLVAGSSDGARTVWRFLHVDRPIPQDLEDHIIQERDFGRELRSRDRYPFYSIVPAQIRH